MYNINPYQNYSNGLSQAIRKNVYDKHKHKNQLSDVNLR